MEPRASRVVRLLSSLDGERVCVADRSVVCPTTAYSCLDGEAGHGSAIKRQEGMVSALWRRKAFIMIATLST